jgi:Fe-S-cluster containining protein
MPRSRKLPVIENCSGCGVCCLHMGYPAFMDPVAGSCDLDYWQAMPDTLREELMAAIAAYQPPAAGELDGPCLWFDMETRQCKHHHYRPRVCRDFQVGSPGCRNWRWHYRDRILPPASSVEETQTSSDPWSAE